jgi:DNA (cytosine-5)-methyltransferase 1
MYETLRIVEKLKPKYVIWENVKNLLSKKHRHNFDAYLDAMTDLGYANNYQVLNAKDYGVPQNRERVFTVSIRKDIYKGYFFPAPIPLEKRLKDVLEDNVDEKYYLSDERLASLVASTEKERARGNGFKFEPIEKEKIAHAISTKAGSRKTDNYIDEGANHALRIGGLYDKDGKTHQAGSIYSASGTAPALSTMQGGNREPYIVTGGVQIIDDIYKNRPPRFYGKTAPTIRANHAGDLKVAKIYPNKK